jgi:hypothetical protein
MDDIQQAIAKAYLELSPEPQEWVRLVRLRPLVPYSDTEVTAALMAMFSDLRGWVHLIPESNRKVLRQEDHAAAVQVGSEAKHLIAIEPEFYADAQWNCPTPTGPETASLTDEVQAAICEAYLQLSVKQQDWVRLAKLRPAVPYPDAEVTAALMLMTSSGLAHLAPDSNRKVLTDADHAAAVRVAGEENHLLAIENDFFDNTTYAPFGETKDAPAPEPVESEPVRHMTAEQQEKLTDIFSETTAGGGTIEDAYVTEDGYVVATEKYAVDKIDDTGMRYTDYSTIHFSITPDGTVQF